MGKTIKYTVSACALVALALVQVMPASAQSAQPGVSVKKSVKTSGRRTHHARHVAAAPPAHPAWTGADPTKGPGVEMIRKMQAEGRCIIDEGYGRWTACSNQ